MVKILILSLTGTPTHDSHQTLTLMILMGEMLFKEKERSVLCD